RSKLPKWINTCLTETSLNLSTDMAVALTRKFLNLMAQPFDMQAQLGVSMWANEHIVQHGGRGDIVSNTVAAVDSAAGIEAMEVEEVL
ncbi:TFIIH/NER complex ATP-dependent 5'-3' DNA helicase subunit, partial [Coemansia sp. S2]